MGNRALLAGSPTVEINLDRYEQLLYAELKCQQYRGYIKTFNPAIVTLIEGYEETEDTETESEVIKENDV